MLVNHIIAAVLAVFIIIIAGYLADNDYTKLAGLVTAIPISLVALFFAEDRGKTDVINAYMKGVFLYTLCTVILYLLVTYDAAHINNAIIIAIGTWFAIVSLFVIH